MVASFPELRPKRQKRGTSCTPTTTSEPMPKSGHQDPRRRHSAPPLPRGYEASPPQGATGQLYSQLLGYRKYNEGVTAMLKSTGRDFFHWPEDEVELSLTVGV